MSSSNKQLVESLLHVGRSLGVICAVPMIGVSLIVVPIIAAETTEKTSTNEQTIADEINESMQDRNYDQAIAAIDRGMGKDDAPDEYLLYLKGRAYHYASKYEEAVQTFDDFLARYPKSPWTRRVRFAKALTLARTNGFQQAEEIYRDEAEQLLSDQRKLDIAEIYIEFAKQHFQPELIQQKPNYQKALEFYEKALEVAPEGERKTEITLNAARCLQELKNYDEAIKRLSNDKLKENVEARFRLGECYLAKSQFAEARRTWQDLIEDHKDSKSERIADASFLIGSTYRFPNPPNKSELSLGVKALNSFVEQYPDHKNAGKALFQITQAYRNQGQLDDAVQAIKEFLADDRFAETDEVALARYSLAECYQLQAKFDDAIAAWKDYLVKHPAGSQWAQAQRQIVDTEFLIAQRLQSEKKYDEAQNRYQAFLAQYPLDGRAAVILFQIGRMQYDQEKWDAAIDAWDPLISKYPQSQQASSAQFLTGVIQEEKKGKFDDAIEQYKKVTGSFQGQARQRIAQLTRKNMRIRTERVYRSNEIPKIEVTARNIEKFTIKSYLIDLETYFRKMHLATGVESLDIALIDPSDTFEFTIEDYEKYKQFEQSVELKSFKKNKSGVQIVTVSSDEMEATTMVIQSDLEIVVKSSRDELFVFAQNLRTGKPWRNARLLISDGNQVIAEAKTNNDGVFQGSYEELKSCEDVRVFGITGTHTASNVVGLSGLGVSQGLTDRGYIYADRSTYQPGQLVNLKGVIRRVDGDTYVVDEGKSFELNVFDPRNRLIWEEEVKLNEFGSFHSNFVLPPTSPQGAYRLLVSDPKSSKQYQGSLNVQSYSLQKIQLAVETERNVFYRGETIKGKIVAKYYYGAPLVGRAIRYTLSGPDARQFDAKTNDQGEIEFEFPTRDFQETQTLQLTATLPEYNLTTQQPFVIATNGFSIGIQTNQSVYLSNESFEVTVNATDAEGEPAGRDLTLKVFKQTNVNGRRGEELVTTKKIKTTTSEGIGRVSIAMKDGGSYNLRVEGVDRFDNTIIGQRHVQISGEDDSIRLRVFASKHSFKVGDAASATIHWREKPALALVTHQGARVLGYELLQLKKGANKIEIPMTAELAPNFDLDVVVMTDSLDSKAERPVRLHTATTSFNVQRQLIVEVESDKKGKAKPGDQINLKVTSTDPQGNPVQAELSLAMIEQSLLDRFGTGHTPIDSFFHLGRRQSAVRTQSSISFRYQPRTQRINAMLLAEEDRLEIEGEEREQLDSLSLSSESFSNGVQIGGFMRDGSEPDEEALFGAGGGYAGGANGGALGGGAYGQADPGASVPQLMPQQGGQRKFNNLPTAGRSPARGVFQAYASDSGVLGDQLDYRDRFGGQRDWESAWSSRAFSQNQSVDMFISGGYANVSPQMATNGITAITEKGKMIQLAMADLEGQRGERVLAALRADNATILPGLPSHEVGYWNPSLVTNKEGEASIEVTVPDRATAWKFVVKGITKDTLAGEAHSSLRVAKDLFGDLKLPMAFVDGDQASIIATIQQSKARKDQEVSVTLKTTIGGKTSQQTKKLPAKKGAQDILFDTKLVRPAIAEPDEASNATFELIVSSGEQTDTQRRVVPLLPYGLPVFGTASGTASSNTTAWVQLPERMPATSPSLQIVVGPTIEQGLLDVLFGPSLRCGIFNGQFASPYDTTSSDLIAAIALQKLFGKTRDAGSPQAEAIDTRIRSAISSLISSQRDDGSWAWANNAAKFDRYISARTVWALAMARSAGYRIPDDVMNRAVQFLESQNAKTAIGDYESKAILLHATTMAGKADFPMANRLYRNRQAMSNSALLYLALAMSEMDRKPLAEELLTLVSERGIEEVKPRRLSKRSSLPWSHAAAELRAMYALALQGVRPKDPKVGDMVEWLLANRVGNRWNPDKATGPATLAACNWFARSKFETERYELTVFVNDKEVKKLDFNQHARTQTVNVPAELLQPGKQRVNFQLNGRGRFSYQCVMEGFVAADKLKSTTNDWRVTRYYNAAPLERDGRAIKRGFDVVDGSYSSFRNQFKKLPVARRGQVSLRIGRNGVRSDVPEEHLEYLVITEPIPSGVTVIEDTVRGGFERFEIGAGVITFYIGNRRYISDISYDVHGFLPGEYRVAPPVLRDAYRPDMLATTSARTLDVLPIDKTSDDPYKVTPREHFELGKWHYAKQEWAEAAEHLKKLNTGWKLKPEFHKQTTEMLLNSHLEIGPPNEVVFHFEAIKERWPEIEIPYGKILKIGDAYHDMGEYERAYLIFRGTVESSFLTDSQVAGFLKSQDELLRSVDVMSSLIRQYPPESYVAAATFDLAQQVFAMAPLAKTKPCLREKKLSRVDLTKRALMMLNGFVTAYPEDPGADQAAFSMATAMLELDQYDPAIVACKKYVERYPASQDIDGFWYTIGFCHFALGQHKEALDVCSKVVEMKVKDPESGLLVESQNRYRAIYILGQIYHSLGEAAKAIEQYTRVSERFADAKEAISYFTRRDISLPEVTTIEPGKPAEVDLAFRNVPECETKVYRIDLMKFSLLRRNLQGITNINLAGIQPLFEENVELGDGKDYRNRERKIKLPLKEEGAYLVVCRGEDQHTSGLVLISPLTIDIQEDSTSGRVRAIVKDRTTEKYYHDVHVKVIGSSNSEFTAGETDLRGIFVADGIQGTSTVIAQTENGRYAFYRGTQHLGAVPQPQTVNAADNEAGQMRAQKKGAGKDVLLEGIYGRNESINRDNSFRQEQQLYNNNSGVQVEIVK